jgi:hypothetical protein
MIGNEALKGSSSSRIGVEEEEGKEEEDEGKEEEGEEEEAEEQEEGNIRAMPLLQ